MEHIFVEEIIAFYKSTNTKIALNIYSNLPKCRQACTGGTVPSNELIKDDGGSKNGGLGGGGKAGAGGNDKLVVDRHRQQST